MDAKKMRMIFEDSMEDYAKTSDKNLLCEVSSTFALFAILDELQRLRADLKKK